MTALAGLGIARTEAGDQTSPASAVCVAWGSLSSKQKSGQGFAEF